MAKSGKHIKHNLPHEVSEYIKVHYEGGTITDIKEVKVDGHIHYKVELEDNDNLHRLEFNQKGSLVKQEAEPLYPEDSHEDFFREEGFYEENY